MDDLLKISRDIDKKNEQMLLDLSLETAEPTEVKGRIHSVECFDSHHGPGVRYVIFLKGCSMRCMYCMDSDTWDPDTDDMQTAEELLDHAERYHSYWRNGGGITVSGGEPLLQIDFLLELFRQAKERGIHTCIDTSLQPFSGEEPFFSKFAVLMQLTDLVIADIKHIDPDEHIKLTGRPFDSIREGFEYLSEIKKKLWIRQVLVPGINDSDSTLKKTREFIESLENVEKIEVLPYSHVHEDKWEALGLSFPLKGVETPGKEKLKHAENILKGLYGGTV